MTEDNDSLLAKALKGSVLLGLTTAAFRGGLPREYFPEFEAWVQNKKLTYDFYELLGYVGEFINERFGS